MITRGFATFAGRIRIHRSEIASVDSRRVVYKIMLMWVTKYP
jgi:hypothetical protein